MISVIIPTYNSASTIDRVLNALFQQKGIEKDEYEVLIVDDCSTDNTLEIVKNFSVSLISLDKNLGPAVARNRGVKEAKGELVAFIDSDVVLKEDALLIIKKKFAGKSYISVLVGIYAEKSANSGPFRSYLALRKYSNWFDPRSEFISFLSSSLTVIKKDIFLEFGGFDNRYRGADVEDFELGYRITDKYKISLADDVQGYHYFPSFIKTVKNFFKRTFQWSELFAKRKKFNTVAATTKKRAIGNLAGFISLIIFIFSIRYSFLCAFAFFAFMVFLLNNLKFYSFVVQKKGVVFLLYALVLDYIFALVVGVAALLSVINQCRLCVMPK
ncbi:MAG: glycosyltransferase [Candidatus Omnitrophica bacterium]|nr:glycosyltransferase [Candidatus Omnitrophota bacterium]